MVLGCSQQEFGLEYRYYLRISRMDCNSMKRIGALFRFVSIRGEVERRRFACFPCLFFSGLCRWPFPVCPVFLNCLFRMICFCVSVGVFKDSQLQCQLPRCRIEGECR